MWITETVISNALGGETKAYLAHIPVLESILLDSDGKTVDINAYNAQNVVIGMGATDIINVDYRYRDSDPILLLTQPAHSIISVTGSVSGALTAETNYHFNNVDDILLEGNSSKANRTVQIKYANGIPVGDMTSTMEDFVLVNNEYKALGQKGIDEQSLIVRDSIKIYALNVDYLVIPESEGVNVQLARALTSSIPNGGNLEVYYDYGEILTIKYLANPLVKIVQDQIEVTRHITADVLVKEVLATAVDIEMSVVLNDGADKNKVVSDIRTAISNKINKLRLGESLAQSDIIGVIELVTNVKSIIVPLARMVKADGTYVNREYISKSFEMYSSNTVTAYHVGDDTLLYKTLGSTGDDGFYAVFEDDRPLTLVSMANDVDNASGQCFITSTGDVIVSTIDSDAPDTHTWTVSYMVSGETGAKDIPVTSLEYLTVGDVVITTAS